MYNKKDIFKKFILYDATFIIERKFFINDFQHWIEVENL